MKRLLPFLARLVVISLLLLPVLSVFHQFYKFVLAFITTATMPTSEIMNSLPYDSSNNLYIFFVLILAIPGMKIKKRVIGIVTGIALFLCTDFFMTSIWTPYLMTPRPSLTNLSVPYGWNVFTHHLLPFLLWFGFAFKQIDSLFRQEAATSS